MRKVYIIDLGLLAAASTLAVVLVADPGSLDDARLRTGYAVAAIAKMFENTALKQPTLEEREADDEAIPDRD